MSSELVHRYLWREYSLLIHKCWILTVTDAEALALFSFVTTLIAYTQSRAWHLERGIFNRLTAPKVQLPVPDQREFLSQGAAIGILVRLWNPRRRSSTQLDRMNRESPWLGLLAIANILGFISLGIILPWSFSGGVEMPLVLSRNSDDCIVQEYPWYVADANAILADQTFRQCWMNRSEISGPCSRLDGILAERPEVAVSRHDGCLFKGETCKGNFQTVRLEHSSLSLRDFGVNSLSKISIGHRLTCSPLETVTFLNVPSPYDCKGVSISFYDPNVHSPGEDFAESMMTCNGPNRYSDGNSGEAVFGDVDFHQVELRAWPSLIAAPLFGNYKLHPDLQRHDGQVFVLSFKAGSSMWPVPIDDPLFSAHQLWPGISVSDQEVTAIGCLEQYRICNRKITIRCTPWISDGQNITRNDQNIFSLIDDRDNMSEIYAAIQYLVNNGSVRDYLTSRRSANALLSWVSMGEGFLNLHDVREKEQWIKELTGWLEISLLHSRYMMMSMTPSNPRTSNFWGEQEFENDEAANQNGNFIKGQCSRILFYDANYTNVNFIQLLVVLCSFLCLCVLSFERQVSSMLGKASRYCGVMVDCIVECRSRYKIHFAKMRVLWPRQRSLVDTLPQTYPRNPFQDPRNRAAIEVYNFDEICRHFVATDRGTS